METLDIRDHELSYSDLKVRIRSGLNRVAEGFVEIGYHLKQVRDRELYLEDGYGSINDFALKEYGLTQSNTSRFISINENYSVGGNSSQLLPEFEGYGSSKLSEMLTLSPDEMKLISIRSTVAEIRTIKEAKKEAQYHEYSDNYATSHKPESLENTQSDTTFEETKNPAIPEGNIIVIEFFRDKSRREVLKGLASLLREGTNKGSISEAVAEIINPSGHLMFRKGMHILVFGEENIKYSRFAGSTAEYTYIDFMHDTSLAFDMAAEDPWVTFYGEPEPEELVKEQKPEATKKVEPEKEVKASVSEKKEVKTSEKPEVTQSEEEQISGQAVIEDYPEMVPEMKDQCFIKKDIADGLMCSGGISEKCNTCDKYEPVEQKPNPITIGELDFSVNTYNCLKRAGIDTIEELCKQTRDDVIAIRNISQKCLDEITIKLSEIGKTLNSDNKRINRQDVNDEPETVEDEIIQEEKEVEVVEADIVYSFSGCLYCGPEHKPILEAENIMISINGSRLVIHTGETKFEEEICFCPKCGKEIEYED